MSGWRPKQSVEQATNTAASVAVWFLRAIGLSVVGRAIPSAAAKCKTIFALHRERPIAIAACGESGGQSVTDLLLTRTAKSEWAALLDQIETSIGSALDNVDRQERALRRKSEKPFEIRPATDRLSGLRSRLEAAGRLGDEVETLLAADEHEARAWVGLAERTRARLASSPAHRVS
jgi:hypothetical protein